MPDPDRSRRGNCRFPAFSATVLAAGTGDGALGAGAPGSAPPDGLARGLAHPRALVAGIAGSERSRRRNHRFPAVSATVLATGAGGDGLATGTGGTVRSVPGMPGSAPAHPRRSRRRECRIRTLPSRKPPLSRLLSDSSCDGNGGRCAPFKACPAPPRRMPRRMPRRTGRRTARRTARLGGWRIPGLPSQGMPDPNAPVAETIAFPPSQRQFLRREQECNRSRVPQEHGATGARGHGSTGSTGARGPPVYGSRTGLGGRIDPCARRQILRGCGAPPSSRA